MTTTKEETINKLSNLTWQRKLNIRNLRVNCRANPAVTSVAKIERVEKMYNRDKSAKTPAYRPSVPDKNEQTENETPDRVVQEKKPEGGVRNGRFTHTGYDKRCQQNDEKENLGYNNGNVPLPASNTRRRRRLSVVNVTQNKSKNCHNVQHCDGDGDGDCNVKAKAENRNDEKLEPKPVSGTNYTVRQKLMRASKSLQLNRDESNVHRDIVLEYEYPWISSNEVPTGTNQFTQYPLNQEPNRKDYCGDGNDDDCRYETTSRTKLALLNLVGSHQNYILPNERPNPDKYGCVQNQNEMNGSRSSYYGPIRLPLHGSLPCSGEPRPNHFIRYDTPNSGCSDSYTNNPTMISCTRFQSNQQELTKKGGEISSNRQNHHYDDEAIARQGWLFNDASATLSRPVSFQLDSRRQISVSQNRNHDGHEASSLRVNSYANISQHPAYSEMTEERNDEYERESNSIDIGFPSSIRANDSSRQNDRYTFVEYDSNNNKGGGGGGGGDGDCGFANFVVMPTNESHPTCLVNEAYGDERRRLGEKQGDDNRHSSYFNAANSDLTPAMQNMNIHNVAKLLCDVNNAKHVTATTMSVTPEARDITAAFQRYDVFEPSSNFHCFENERLSESRAPTNFCIAENKTGIATNLAFYQKFNDLNGNLDSIASPSPTIVSSSSSSSSSLLTSSKNSNRNLESEMLIVASNKDEPFDNRLSCQRISAKSEVKSEVGDAISTTNNSYANATRPQPSTFKKNLIRRANDDLFDDRIRFSRPRRDSMTINVKDDCFINFDRKAFENCVNFKLNAQPAVGILKKSAKWQNLPLSECSIQFTRSHADEGIDEVDVLLQESKKVSFSPYVRVTE